MKNGIKVPWDPNIKSKTCKGSLETGQLGCSGKINQVFACTYQLFFIIKIKYLKNGIKIPLDPTIKSKICKSSLETGQLGCSGKSSVYLYLPPIFLIIKMKYH